MYHSLDMPYRNAFEAFQNLKTYTGFNFNGSTTRRQLSSTITASQFVQGISTVRRPKRNVYVFAYNFDIYNHVIFMYEKETGSILKLDHQEAEFMLRKLLLIKMN
jgi:hypothetical protein